MNRLKTLALLAIFCTFSQVFADPPMEMIGIPQPPPGMIFRAAVVESMPDKVNQPTNDALDKTLVNVAQGTPLQKALIDIAASASVKLNIDWKAFEEAGIARNAAIPTVLNQVSARQALRTVLATQSAEVELTFLVNEGQVLVSTREELRRRFQLIQVFDVGSLTADLEPNTRDALDIQQDLIDTLTGTIEANTWRDNGGTVGLTRILNNKLIVNQSYDVMPAVEELVTNLLKSPRTETRSYDVKDLLKDAPPPDALGRGKLDDLINAIESSCGRDTWRDRGGRTSSVAPFENKLIITTTPAVHQQIEALLGLMRKKE